MSSFDAIGSFYKEFKVTKSLPIEELHCVLRELEHIPTGAQVMHIACDDPENLFCLSFKTYPSSSDGAAHILEHTVLCGSKLFPVKDPFFAMTRRSLNTFMNAITGADFTCYPAASQNEKDFYNLLSVYLDAVFHPLLQEMSFLQEGHRLEFIDPKDPSSPLQIKGIVFNEMKGSLSSVDSRLWHTLMEHLLPDLPYSYNSGGDPKVIPQLSYTALKEFHKTYYHPSRCLFFFYGNLPLEKHLDFLSEHALKGVDKQLPIPPIQRQARFTTPLYKEIYYPVNTAEEEPQVIVVFGFLTTAMAEQEDLLALSVLDSALMDNDASILKALLLESKLCVQVDAYIDPEMSEVPYAIVCQGCLAENVEALEQVLNRAFEKIVQTGISQETVNAAIHQLEFSRLEITADHAPFGLSLFMRAALAKQHGCKTEDALTIHSLFNTLLDRVKDRDYLPSLIRRYFLDNPHRVRLTMHPDPELCEEESSQEKQMLRQLREKLSGEEVKTLLKQTQDLATFQQAHEQQSLDCLPKVSLSDVTRSVRDFPLESSQLGTLRVHHHDTFTNHITYADLFCDLPPIAKEDLPYFYLLISLLPELGCAERSYAENLNVIQSSLGHIHLSFGMYSQVTNPQECRPSLHIKAKALERHQQPLLTMMRQMLTSPRLDEVDRIGELIKKMREAQLHQLNRRSMTYATHLALSGFSNSAYVSECCNGLTYFKTIQKLSKTLPGGLPALIDKLVHLKETLFSCHEPTLVLSCSKKAQQEMAKANYFGLSTLEPIGPKKCWSPSYPLITPASQVRPIASQVAFTVEAFSTVTYLHPDAPALFISTALLDHLVLHRQIREQGGAYGCGVNYNTLQGHFHFHSYRDPHLASTLKTFHEAIDKISSGHFSAQDLEEAKLSLLQQLDTPVSPSQRALIAYSWMREGKTGAMRQHFRDRLLDLTKNDIQAAVAAQLLPQKEKGIVVCFASKELVAKEQKALSALGRPLEIIPL